MAILKKGYGSKVKSLPSSSVYSSSTLGSHRLSGPELADHVFGVDDYDPCYPCDPEPKSNIDREYLTEENYQFELDLEPIQDYEEKLRALVRRYERAYNKMAMNALRWHQLVEDVESKPHIRELFENMQVMRRLSGSDYE